LLQERTLILAKGFTKIGSENRKLTKNIGYSNCGTPEINREEGVPHLFFTQTPRKK
jgi:hypothetical protein